MNEHLKSISSGDTETAIEVYVKGHQIKSPRPYISPGRYAFKVLEAEIVAHKSREDARNLHVKSECIGPDAFKGLGPFERWIPIPSARDDKANRSMADFLVSIFSGQGKADELVQRETVKLAPKQFVGKTWYSRVEDEELKDKDDVPTGKMGSKLSWPITKEEYESKPGPDESIGAGAPKGKQEKKGAADDLLGGANGETKKEEKKAGGKKGAPAADDLLGI